MKPIISAISAAAAISVSTSIHSTLAFTPQEIIINSRFRTGQLTELRASSFVTRTPPFETENTGGQIDAALSEIQSLHSQRHPNDKIMEEMHTILSDGQGHLNSELARSIWDWENSQRIISQSSNDGKEYDGIKPTTTTRDKLFPAAQLKFSTRRGLRIVDSIAHEVEHGDRYPDLIQEGVVALMGAMVEFDPIDGEVRFEAYARGEIKNAMEKALVEGGGAKGQNWLVRDVLSKSKMPKRTEKAVGRMDAVDPHDQIVAPFRNFVADDNPTPEDIALTDMIQHDISEFLDRILDENELKVVRMKFDLDGSASAASAGGMNLMDIANYLEIDLGEVKETESRALEKLRTSFSNDYIGAYLDDDHAEEVSL